MYLSRAASVSIRYLGTANLARELNRDIEEAYARALSQLDNTSQAMQALAKENQHLKESLPGRESLIQEILAQYPGIQSVAIAEERLTGRDTATSGEVTLVTLLLKDRLEGADRRRVEDWLQTRFKNQKVVVLTGNAPAAVTARE